MARDQGSDVPEDWEVRSLRDVVIDLTSGDWGSADEDAGQECRVIRGTDFEKLTKSDLSQVPIRRLKEKSIETRRLVGGDLLVEMSGGSKDQQTGRILLAEDSLVSQDSQPFVFSNFVKRLRLDTGAVLPEYFYLYWRFLYQLRRMFIYEKRTTGIRNFKLSDFLTNECLAIPPIKEQRAIAHVLRTVQRAKEATEKVIAAARQLKQSLMRHLFTYGPVPFHEAGQVDIRGTDFGAAPANWTIMRLDECAEVQTGVAKGRKLNSTETVTLPYLRVANVQDGFLDLTEIKTLTIRSSEIDRYSLRRGDVVLTEGGDFDKLGRGFIWTEEVSLCIHQNHIFAVRANRELLLPEFLAYMTQSNYGKAYFLSVAHKTTNLACINTTKLKAFPALLPELEGQRSIIERLRFVDRKIAAEEAKRSSLESLFSSLLHELMTGQTRVD